MFSWKEHIEGIRGWVTSKLEKKICSSLMSHCKKANWTGPLHSDADFVAGTVAFPHILHRNNHGSCKLNRSNTCCFILSLSRSLFFLFSILQGSCCDDSCKITSSGPPQQWWSPHRPCVDRKWLFYLVGWEQMLLLKPDALEFCGHINVLDGIWDQLSLWQIKSFYFIQSSLSL